ncbi:hypothetical protein Scep_024017 [Stephania cephalantha]|uniref:Uncharacterized protein n=1 Tax=Stephania cephalantha TaxID=152367 RepID=A0AAP0HWR9_9MAGN
MQAASGTKGGSSGSPVSLIGKGKCGLECFGSKSSSASHLFFLLSEAWPYQ